VHLQAQIMKKLMLEAEEYCDRDWVTEQICNENNE